jgi:uncharacterized protein (TIGR02646 family)
VRRVSAPPSPAALVGPDSVGGRERQRVLEFYGVRRNREKSFEYEAYKHEAVKALLNETFHRKCAYCESSYAAVAPVDVEHYRPKGGVAIAGELKKPGYYWLAAEWKNLLPSCIDCNRERTQTFPDLEPALSGKANKFPLASEASRATEPGKERDERRLLLHPYLDRPDTHLEFIERGLIRPRLDSRNRESRKGKASIETYGLRRRYLVDARAARELEIRAWMRSIERRAVRLRARPDPQAEQELLEDVAHLRSFTEPNSPYSAMARALIEPFIARILA